MGELDFLLNIECPECPPEDLGPPPDDILSIPPPPLPFFLQVDTNNESSTCHHQCAWPPHHPSVQLVELTNRESDPDNTWLFLLGASCIAVLLLGGLLTILIIKFRSKISNKSSIQVASTIVTTKGCESVLYPYPPPPAPDSRILWATLTPKGTTHHFTTSSSQVPQPYRTPCKPTLPPPNPPVTFDNTGFVDSDSQSLLMESYQLNELVDSDGVSESGEVKRSHRPRVSTPTRIEHPNLPPLNLHPHRSMRRATMVRRNSEVSCPSDI